MQEKINGFFIENILRQQYQQRKAGLTFLLQGMLALIVINNYCYFFIKIG